VLGAQLSPQERGPFDLFAVADGAAQNYHDVDIESGLASLRACEPNSTRRTSRSP
jgi:hypothetical protein